MLSNFDQLLNYVQKFTFPFLVTFFFKILFQISIFIQLISPTFSVFFSDVLTYTS